jgi:hypothetical protein
MNFELLNVPAMTNCTMEEIPVEEPQIVQIFDIKPETVRKLGDIYETMRRRHGETMAKTIIAAGIAACLSNVPASAITGSLPFVGLIELVSWIKANPKVFSEVGNDYRKEIPEIIRLLVKS